MENINYVVSKFSDSLFGWFLNVLVANMRCLLEECKYLMLHS